MDHTTISLTELVSKAKKTVRPTWLCRRDKKSLCP